MLALLWGEARAGTSPVASRQAKQDNILRFRFVASMRKIRIMRRKIDPQHEDTRNLLRLVGVLVVGVGLLFTIIGVGSFFSAFGSFQSPRYFWCVFVGMPLLGLGSVICKFAFMGTVSRYIAGEVAPVGKDVVNYMVDGTKDSVRDLAAAVSEGIDAGRHNHAQAEDVCCPKCNHANDREALFCNNCGTRLATTKTCPNCKNSNDLEAKFCDNCGRPLE